MVLSVVGCRKERLLCGQHLTALAPIKPVPKEAIASSFLTAATGSTRKPLGHGIPEHTGRTF
ncbi:hypothetical protein SAMN05414139_06701 [Burkholderia sp. D7]|nr:hypothetical protein SAMN05414139_06701 [Burkholderia sp. D7]